MIQIKNLSKRFDNFVAVDGISFQVEPGEVLGFLGPNGAGKSTTMKMLTGFLEPSQGEVSVMGHDVVSSPIQVQSLIGYLPEGAPSYGDMSVRKFLEFVGQVRGFVGAELKQRVENVVAQVNLQSVMEQSIETLSKGFKRRVGLAQAIIHDPKVLILDEPTDGLDPNQKHQVRELIRNLAADKIVIVSTHILEEVSAVCSRAMILASGKILFDGTPEALASKSKYHNALVLKLASGAQDAIVSELKGLDAVAALEADELSGRMTLFPESGQSILAQVNHVLHAHDAQVEELHIEKGRLDDVFRNVTMAAHSQ